MVPTEDFKHYPPIAWAMKTRDVRVFGYFPRKSTFVAVCGAMRKDLQGHDGQTTNQLFRPMLEAVRQFARNLDLDPPKYLTGVTLNAVL
jgi:hypothetical protein